MLPPPEHNEETGLQILVPSSLGNAWQPFVETARTHAVEPFSPTRTDAMDALSKDLLRHPKLGRDPAAAALGFWLRHAHTAGFKKSFFEKDIPGLRVPAGLVLHIAPANVDTMFIYSWALSFLAGNANIVRLTSRRSALMDELLSCLNGWTEAHRDACSGNAFVAYGHDDTITAFLSAVCDLRITWGGDETVTRLRAIPLNPHAGERSFASKRSLSLISITAFAQSDEAARRKLAERMAADVVPFGQMACSSPHVVYWLGPPSGGKAPIGDFGRLLESAMASKMSEPDLGWAVRRLNHAFDAAAKGEIIDFVHEPHATQLQARDARSAEADEPCGAGLLNHATLESVEAIGPLLRRDHQTITYFGLTDAEKHSLAALAGRAGVDRIVPVGHALDFGPYWDGYSLWDDLTRVVAVE
ncbi:MAG: acyl-CoA reductase [Opitutaceae bacterium]|jgi:hypothetical protein